jgi:hypothetical protein
MPWKCVGTRFSLMLGVSDEDGHGCPVPLQVIDFVAFSGNFGSRVVFGQSLAQILRKAANPHVLFRFFVTPRV